jgi:hypothetical protein
VFFIITATIFAFTRYGLRLRLGLLWLGVVKGDRLFRLGLVSFDTPNRGKPNFSISIRCETGLGAMDLVPVQYFDKDHITVVGNDDLDVKANDGGPDVESTNKETVPAFSLQGQNDPSSSISNYAWPRPLPAAASGSSFDPEIDRMIQSMYRGAAPNVDYSHQVHAGPPLVPNRLAPRQHADGSESVVSGRSTGSAIAESPLKLLLYVYRLSNRVHR